jgi:hypothetical protein
MLNEGIFDDFSKTFKKDDILVALDDSAKELFKFKIVGVYGNQINLFNKEGEKIIFSSGGLVDDELEYIIIDKKGVKEVKIVENIDKFLLYRGGKLIDDWDLSELSKKDKDEDDREYEKNIQLTDTQKEISDEIISSLKKLKKYDTVSFNLGVITPSEGKMVEDIETELIFNVESAEDSKNNILLSLIEVKGEDTQNYSKWIGEYRYIKLNTNRKPIFTRSGDMVFHVKFIDGKRNTENKDYITGLISIKKISHDIGFKGSLDMEKIIRDPKVLKALYQNPSYLEKLLGKGERGLIPLEKRLADLGLYPEDKKSEKVYKTGRKVMFTNSGDDTITAKNEPNFKLLNDGTKYIGRMVGREHINLSSPSRRSKFKIVLNREIKKDVFEVTVYYQKSEGELGEILEGKTEITILEYIGF